MLQYLKTLFFLVTLFLHITKLLGGTYNVINFGAQAGETTDSSQAFLDAWAAACSSTEDSTVYSPAEAFLLANPIIFSGDDCTDKNITVQIDGRLVASSDYTEFSSGNWIIFKHVHWVTVHGGILDGKGKSLWECKISGKPCPFGATSLGIYHSQNVVINKTHSINSQSFHVIIYDCENVHLEGLRISSPGTSPNTDGVHIQYSSGVTVSNSHIGTGDDCISIGYGAINVWIQNVFCGPGHGISIGSLGKLLAEPGVQNVTVKNINFSDTINGVRIKTWSRRSNGFVKQVVFQNITMANVEHPIIIDQNYCPYHPCPHEGSGVKISGVTYQQIQGTSAKPVALSLDCSNIQPCGPIIFNNIYLTYGGQPAEAYCSHVSSATSQGTVVPNCRFNNINPRSSQLI